MPTDSERDRDLASNAPWRESLARSKQRRGDAGHGSPSPDPEGRARSPRARQVVLVLVALGLAVGVAGYGVGSARQERSEESNTAARNSAAPKPGRVRLVVQDPPEAVTTESVTLEGRATPGARVVADDVVATVEGGRFTVEVPVAIGDNRIELVAQKQGMIRRRKVVRLARQPLVAEPTRPSDSTSGTDETPTCATYQDFVPGEGCVGEPNTPPDCPPGKVPAGVTGACAPADESEQSEDTTAPTEAEDYEYEKDSYEQEGCSAETPENCRG